MTIQVNVESYDELVEFARKLLEPTLKEPAVDTRPVPAVDVTPEPVPLPEPEPEPVPFEEPEKTYTITEVRAYLGNLRKAGKKEEVTQLISDMGYEKFTQVPEERYAELMKRAEEL